MSGRGLPLAAIGAMFVAVLFDIPIAFAEEACAALATGLRDIPQRVRDAQAALREGNALRCAGRIADATAAYRRAVWLNPEGGAGHFNLGIALRQARDWRGATLSFRRAARLDARDFDAVQNVVGTLAAAIGDGAPSLFPRPCAPRRPGRAPVSIVVCSIDDARLAAMQASFRAALGDREHEFIVIRDARSLSEGYERGLRKSRYPTVVFSHDDVELLSACAFEAFDEALEHHDIAGPAGAALVRGPAVMWAGQPHLRGWVAYPASDSACLATVFSLEYGVLGGMQALDGMLFAARREAALKIGFDTATFDGFHFYDLDFTYRAHLAGLRIAVTTEIVAMHASAGVFDQDWRHYAQRFMAKFPHLTAPKGEHHAYSARLPSPREAARLYEELRGLAAIA
jgi:hypothetical protein